MKYLGMEMATPEVKKKTNNYLKSLALVCFGKLHVHPKTGRNGCRCNAVFNNIFFEVEKMVEEFDDDGSGLIEFEEFLVLMAKKVAAFLVFF